MTNKKIVYVIVLIVTLVIVTGIFLGILKNRKNTNITQVNTTTKTVQKLNSLPAYSEFLAFSKIGDNNGALEKLNEIKKTEVYTTDVGVQNQIDVHLGRYQDTTGQKKEAVDTFKTIIDKNGYDLTSKSFAYEYLSRMVYETRDPEITQYIMTKFGIPAPTTSQDKYAYVSEFLLKGSQQTSPYYLSLVKRLFIESTENIATLEKNQSIVIASDKNLSNYIDQAKANEKSPYRFVLPMSLLYKAKFAELAEKNKSYKLDKSVEDIYKEAVEMYTLYPDIKEHNYVYLEYARYLAVKYGSSRSADIKSLLAHYDTNPAERQNLVTYITNIETTKTPLSTYKELELLKKITNLPQ